MSKDTEKKFSLKEKLLIAALAVPAFFIGLFQFIGFVYQDAYGAAGLYKDEMKDSVFIFAMTAILVTVGVTLLVALVLGMCLLGVFLVVGLTVEFFKYIWPAYAVFGAVCLGRWIYLKTEKMRK